MATHADSYKKSSFKTDLHPLSTPTIPVTARCRMDSYNPRSETEPKFHQFNRLSFEIRLMIWHLTLQPRIVEVLWADDGASHDCNDPFRSTRNGSEDSYERSDDADDAWTDISSGDSDGFFEDSNGESIGDISEDSDATSENSIPDKEIRFCSYTALPAALGVCHESRAAVSGLYPLCFASNTHGAAIRFNFSIDTLFFDDHIDPYLYQFLNNLSSIELSKLRYLAIMEDVGHDDPDGDWQKWDKCWDGLMEQSKRFSNLGKVSVVLNVLRHLQDIKLQRATIAQVDRDWKNHNSTKAIQLFKRYPWRLIERYDLNDKQVPRKCSEVMRRKWFKEHVKFVWG